jgi:hypothetical protein
MIKDYDNLSDSSLYVKSKVTNLSGLDETVWGADQKDVIYNPITDDKICCIEMANNNKIYISYHTEWTIKNVKTLSYNPFSLYKR